MSVEGGLVLFERAKAALTAALTADEAMKAHDLAEQARLYGRQARDKGMIADATAIMLRAERRLGELLSQAREAGQIRRGRPPAERENVADADNLTPRVLLTEAGIDRRDASKAKKLADLSPERFEELLTETRDKIMSSGAVIIDPIRDLSLEQKQERRAERERDLGARQRAFPEKRYGVIYADPPWKWRSYDDITGFDRAPENHYPTRGTDEIAAMPVPTITHEDCVLWLWATVPLLPDALRVMEAWGFTYKTNFVWVKESKAPGTGYWSRNRHELLLVGTRGKPPAPAPGTQDESVWPLPLGEHSVKPEEFAAMIEWMFPTMPKIELFARAARDGWDRWGFEAPEDEAADAA